MLVREIYPLLYRNIGGASKHAMQFIPSDKQRLQLLRHFHESSYESFVAHRNILMVDIASTVGFRRGSIISLQASQFTQLTVQELSGDYVAIKPPAQKFSYEDYFEIPVALAERIRAYVNDYLRPYCQSRKWRMDSEWLPLFISTRDGARLTDRSATKIVSSGLRAIGVPSGNALHSFRRRFANAELDREIELRRAAGLDLSVETLCVVISQRLGHRSASSLFAYVSKRLSLSAAKLAAGTGE